MTNTVSVTRADTGAELPTAAVDIALDADSHTWRFGLTLLGVAARDAVDTGGTTPRELIVTVNGYSWRCLAESWSEEVSFAKRAIKVVGRGLTAELAAPYQLPTSRVNLAGTVEQVLASHLPLGSGWSLVWGATEVSPWAVPAGAWSVSQQSPLSAIQAGAVGVGLRLSPRRTERVIDLMPRYPVLPWYYATATPDWAIPREAILSYSRQQPIPPQANAVVVHGGTVGGILGSVKRSGTAGDRLINAHDHALITHADAARLMGGRLLAAEHNSGAWQSLVIPLGGDYPLLSVGGLLAIEAGNQSERQTVSGVSISAAQGSNGLSVRQSVTLGEQTDNRWAQFTRLMPSQPQLIGTVTANHGDDTATVSLIGGGSCRARNATDLSMGAQVFVSGGIINGTAPNLTAYTIEV